MKSLKGVKVLDVSQVLAGPSRGGAAPGHRLRRPQAAERAADLGRGPHRHQHGTADLRGLTDDERAAAVRAVFR